MSEQVAARSENAVVGGGGDDDWVDVDLWVEEVVLVPDRREAGPPPPPLDLSRAPVLVAYAPLRARSGNNGNDPIIYYDEQDEAFADEARLRERDRKQAARLLGKQTPVAAAALDKRMGPMFQLEMVAASPAARPAFSQRFGEKSQSSYSFGGDTGAYDPFSGSASPKRHAAPAMSTADSLRDQKERMEREYRHQQQREAHYEELKRKDPFQAARYLEKMERKRLQQPTSDAAARAEKKARKEQKHRSDRESREGGKRERESREAGSAAKKEKKTKEKKPPRADEGKEPDMVAFKANLSGAVSTALKPFFVANKIADKESFKHLCRKLTKTLVQKERERGNAGKWHPKLGSAAAKFVESFMRKLDARGQVYAYVEGQTSDATLLLDTSLELNGSMVAELKAGGSQSQQSQQSQQPPTMPPMMF